MQEFCRRSWAFKEVKGSMKCEHDPIHWVLCTSLLISILIFFIPDPWAAYPWKWSLGDDDEVKRADITWSCCTNAAINTNEVPASLLNISLIRGYCMVCDAAFFCQTEHLVSWGNGFIHTCTHNDARICSLSAESSVHGLLCLKILRPVATAIPNGFSCSRWMLAGGCKDTELLHVKWTFSGVFYHTLHHYFLEILYIKCTYSTLTYIHALCYTGLTWDNYCIVTNFYRTQRYRSLIIYIEQFLRFSKEIPIIPYLI